MDIYRIVGEYKIPIFFGLVSILAIALSIVLLVQSTQVTEPIRFSSEEASGSALGASTLTVDMEGAVIHAGVYTLPAGSRVEDAIVAAGGLASDADEELFAKTFNRAAKITDGAKIYIPTKSSDQTSHNIYPIVATTGSSQNGIVSVNYATAAQLDTLSGVGPVTAQKIIDNRPYQTLDELVIKKAIGAALYDKLKNNLSL